MKENDTKRTTIITTIICLIPVLAGAILYSRLPDRIVIHWGADGTPNGWQSRFVGAIVFPGILVLVNLLMPVLMKMDPKYKNMNGKIKALIQWIIPVVSMVCSGSTLAAALGKDVPVMVIAPMLVGVLLAVIGNYMPKTKPSYTVGIRLPWTLNDEENWNKTHRLGGFVFTIGGIATVILGVCGVAGIVFPIVLAAMAAIPTVYSYMLYRASEAKKQ